MRLSSFRIVASMTPRYALGRTVRSLRGELQLRPGVCPLGVDPTVVSPGAIWAQVEPGLESEALLANCALS